MRAVFQDGNLILTPENDRDGIVLHWLEGVVDPKGPRELVPPPESALRSGTDAQ